MPEHLKTTSQHCPICGTRCLQNYGHDIDPETGAEILTSPLEPCGPVHCPSCPWYEDFGGHMSEVPEEIRDPALWPGLHPTIRERLATWLEGHPWAPLTEAQAAEIRQLLTPHPEIN